MVLDIYGQDRWDDILAESGVPADSFISMRRYDDSVTYALVGAASRVLQAPVDKCLQDFGVYWATVTAPATYGVLLDSTGATLIDFLLNVNALHDRITSTFIGYEPPYFDVQLDSNRVALRYESKREGLTPFVVGVVIGLAQRFNNQLEFDAPESIAVSCGETSVIHFRVLT